MCVCRGCDRVMNVFVFVRYMMKSVDMCACENGGERCGRCWGVKGA